MSKQGQRLVPTSVKAVLMTALLLQIIWHGISTQSNIDLFTLPSPPTENLMRIVSLDETFAVARLLMLWLQAFDNQSGVSLPLNSLDYGRVTAWLQLISHLDSASSYPSLVAVRIYALVPNDNKKRQMIEFVSTQFFQQPAARWPSMAHSVLLAKHQLQDNNHALMLARLLRENTTPATAPDWARQMEIFILEEMGEYQSAIILAEAFIETGSLNNPQSLKFVVKRLQMKQGY